MLLRRHHDPGQVVEEKRHLQAAVALVDAVLEVVDAIKDAAPSNEEVRFLMLFLLWKLHMS